MKLPKIDLTSLPDLTNLTGLFASARTHNPGHDDSIIVAMTIIYETTHVGGGII